MVFFSHSSDDTQLDRFLQLSLVPTVTLTVKLNCAEGAIQFVRLKVLLGCFLIFQLPSRENKNGRVALECSCKDFCSLDAETDSVVLDP